MLSIYGVAKQLHVGPVVRLEGVPVCTAVEMEVQVALLSRAGGHRDLEMVRATGLLFADARAVGHSDELESPVGMRRGELWGVYDAAWADVPSTMRPNAGYQ